MPGPKINPAAIDLLARYYNSHRKGLPEWLKNAREVYLRRGAGASERLIFVNFQRDSAPQYLECIDFGGISGDDIEQKYLEWANPEAAAAGLKAGQAEGGQGNGGKAYLRQMFSKGYFISICDGRLSVVSFIDEKKYHLDFVPTHAAGKNVEGDSTAISGIRAYAAGWLKLAKLPPDHNITIVRGVSPVKPIDIDRLLDELQQSPQARETLRSCTARFFVNHIGSRDLKVSELELHPDFPLPVAVVVPEVLLYNGVQVRTAQPPQYPEGQLELRVSRKPLQGQALANWNRIDFHAGGVSAVGFKEGPELPLKQPQLASYIFGRCDVPLLTNPKDNYELQGRGHLNEGLLSAALFQFIGAEADKLLGKLASTLATATLGKRRKNLEKLNNKLASWIESKLSTTGGLSETGEGEGHGRLTRKKREHRDHEPPAKLRIHREKLDICLGVNSYELRAVAVDAGGRPVPPGPVVWKSNDPRIIAIDERSGRVQPRSVGVSTITVKTVGGVSSMPLLAQVYEATEIRIKTSSPAKLGSNRRLPLSLAITTTSGHTVKNAVVEWTSSNKLVVTVGQDGIAVGGDVGDAEASASAGDVFSPPIEIEVEKGAGGKPKGGGQGRPSIRLSGQDVCPFDKQQVVLNATDPPVFQRPYKPDYDSNVFWINLQHPLAAELLKAGEESVRWRTYHFERLVDVFVTIEIRNRFGDSEELDADQLLDEINVAKTNIYAQARTELFDLLYDDNVDLAALVN